MRVAVLGAGQMGVAFGKPALERGHELCFWGPDWIDSERLAAIAAGEPHPDLGVALPGVPALAATDLDEVVDGAEACVLAVSSEGVRWVAERVAEVLPAGVPVLALSKGFARRDGEVVPVGGLAREILGERAVVGVGGPVKAAELARGVPTHTVFASGRIEHAREAARVFRTGYYLPVATDDYAGTGLCAALKNCYAIAVNVISGEFEGANPRSLAFAAALREMSAFASASGGRAETVIGAAGSGDLCVTCITGRNGEFGRLLGEGKSVGEARGIMEGATVEGLDALPLALELARLLGIEDRLPLLAYLERLLRLGGVEQAGGAPLGGIAAE